MTDIERIIATIKDYQDKNLSLEDLQSYFQTLPLCLCFSAQQIEELEEQLETIRFLISDEMQHETVIHYLKPMKNYLESLRSSKIVPLIENLITGKDISIENAQHIEVLLDDYYENDEVIQDFISFGIKSIEQKSQARLRNFLPMPMYSENSAIIIAMVMTKELMGGNGAKIPLGTSPANKNQEGSQKSFPFYKRYPYGREGRKSDGRISVVDLSHRVDSHWSRCFYRGA